MAYAKTKARTNRFVAEMLKADYYRFFVHFWSLISAETYIDNWHIRETCLELQEIAQRIMRGEAKAYDFIANFPPGTSKSSMFSVLWQPWIWGSMPSFRMISGSHTDRLALDLARKTRDVVLSPKYHDLFPHIVLRDDQNTKSHFINTAGGGRYAVGVGGGVIGFHAHALVVDDPIDPQGVLSDAIVQEANTWLSETLSRRKVDALLTPLVMVMQRLHQNDPTGFWLEKGGRIKHWVLPCDDSWDLRPEAFRQFYKDGAGLLDSHRPAGSRQALEEALRDLGEIGYACQLGQSPVPRGGALFKTDRITYQPPSQIPTRWARGPIRGWDKASVVGKDGAYTAGVKLGLDAEDRVWILDVVRGKWDSGFREKHILDIAALDGRDVRVSVEQEPGSGGKDSAEATVRALALAGYRGQVDRVQGDKEMRAEPLSVYVNTGKVVVVLAPWNRDFLEEMRYFPVSRYKDQVDAASGAFAALVKPKLKIGALPR